MSRERLALPDLTEVYMREKLSFCHGWRVHVGELNVPSTPARKGPAYMQGKSESALWGPASRYYDDNSDAFGSTGGDFPTTLWENVTLPHDYTIRQTPCEQYNNARGFFKEECAWYRKKFTLSDDDRQKRLILHFEGISHECVIYVNGHRMAQNRASHLPVVVDFTDVARFGEDNVVAVYIDGKNHEGWWYEGGGIYRPVWLQKTARTAIDTFGIYVHPEKKPSGIWNVKIEATVCNLTTAAADLLLEFSILDAEGNPVASGCTNGSAAPYDTQTVACELPVSSVRLWEPNHPALYTLRTTVLQGEQVLDEIDTRFGFRWVEFTPENGLFLNGKPLKLHGVCCHEDYGLTGRATPESIKRYRVKLLKEMGCNAYRCAHYPHSEGTLDALDEAGILVMDETRTFLSCEESLSDLRRMILRDRNHPSIVLWSIGNEEPLTLHEIGEKIAYRMVAQAHKLDDRPVTMALDREPHNAKVLNALDVISINYGLKPEFPDKVHALCPDKAILAAESCATGGSRGWYEDTPRSYKYLSAYDYDVCDWALSREFSFRYYAARPWHCGFFQWAGIEHRGEAMWPRICSTSGALDLYLIKKDAFYQNQSHFTKEPMVHLLPHWNHEGREGEEFKVVAYSNCPELELFLNGVSQGKQIPDPHGHGEWLLPYEKGTLLAVGSKDGTVLAQETIETSGAPVKLQLTLQTDPRSANDDCAVLHCTCLDENGRMVPDAAPTVEFFCTGGGSILGTGSDHTDHTPPACATRKMYAGVIAVAVRITSDAPIRVFARAQGLTQASLVI